MKISKALTWDDLANLYDKTHSGRPARTLPMEKVSGWAEQQKDKFWVSPEEGTIHSLMEDVSITVDPHGKSGK